jgi:Serine/threonine protein kinase
MMPVKRIIVLALLCVMLAGVVFLRPLRFFDMILYDLNFSLNTRAVSQDSVVIVGIDPASISEVGAWPWPRGTIACLVNKINACSPRVLAIDILFPPKHDNIGGDDSLAAALCKVKNLVLPFRASSIGGENGNQVMSIPSQVYSQRFLMLSHQDKLKDLTLFNANRIDASDPAFSRCAGRSGVINVTTSRTSQKLRQLVQVIKAGEDYYPSFSLSAVASYLDCTPDRFVLDGRSQVRVGNRSVGISSYAGTTLLHFRGRAGSVTTISASQLLSGALDPAVLRDKLVFTGVTDAGTGADFFTTPVGPQFPGVEMWATGALDVLQNTWIRENNRILDIGNIALVFFLFPGLLFIAGGRKRALTVAIASGCVVLSIAAGFLFFSHAQYFWNSANHIYAWLFTIVMLAVQKNVPFFIEYAPLDFSVPQRAEKDVLPAPGENDFARKLPASASAVFVARKLTSETVVRSSASKPAETFSGTAVEENLYKANIVQPVLNTDGTQKEETALTPEQASAFQQLCSGRIVKLLGSGGMADVYLVWNPRVEIYRAVKVIKPGQPSNLLERFETEIRILSKLQHPQIVQFYSVGEWHGLPYIEMEYVPGAALDDVCEKCMVFSPQEAMAVGILICRALHYAHNQVTTIYGKVYKGVIHRDLKPANIMLSRSGRVKLTDFGIARPEEVSLHTLDSGKVVGTLPYLAPEQLSGADITAQVDIYALGATLFELVAGERAFPQTDMNVLLSAKSSGKVRALPGHISQGLQEIIAKAMAVKTVDRYATAAHMEKDLDKTYRSLTDKTLSGYAVLENLVNRFEK